MKPLHLKQCIDASIFRFWIYVYRSRFITNAKQPANNPPPKIVVPNERYALAPLPGEAPSSRSRTPPCTISTERVSNAPIANHHLNDLTDVPETERQEAWMRYLSATVAEGRQAVKKTAFYCSEHIICPVFVARDLSGLGWSFTEGHDDTSTGTTGGATDAV
jgi:hypothetical protein